MLLILLSVVIAAVTRVEAAKTKKKTEAAATEVEAAEASEEKEQAAPEEKQPA